MELPPSDEEQKPVDYKIAKAAKEKLIALKERTRPDNPTLVTGQGKNGRIGSNLTAHIMRGMLKNPIRNQDPREEILKFAKDAAEDPYWIAPAYKNGHVLGDNVYEDEYEAKRDQSKRRRK
jgi:hypothetical protein